MYCHSIAQTVIIDEQGYSLVLFCIFQHSAAFARAKDKLGTSQIDNRVELEGESMRYRLHAIQIRKLRIRAVLMAKP
jgi:hypothetical protein